MLIPILLPMIFCIDIFSQNAMGKCNECNQHLNFNLYPNYGKDWLYFCNGIGERKAIIFNPTLANQKSGFAEAILNTVSTSIEIITHNVSSSMHFYLYNKDDKTVGTKIHPSVMDIANSKLDKFKFTVFLHHGYTDSYQSESVQELKNAYLVSNDYNIIIADWGKIARNLFYPVPMAATKHVGEFVAKFIDMMISAGFDPDLFHLVGLSLGAHIAGFAGQLVSKGKLARVTGLDPALPGFVTGILSGGKISKDSAKFVDIIHTCGGILGLGEPMGHIDFYPNNGVSPQPGCGTNALAGMGCSHMRSFQYFKESIINPQLFPSIGCNSFADFLIKKCENDTIMMGEHTKKTARGNFYLTTNPTPPYGKTSVY